MKKTISILVGLLLVLSFSAHARMGGGRSSMGSRGSSGFSSRSYGTTPFRSQPSAPQGFGAQRPVTPGMAQPGNAFGSAMGNGGGLFGGGGGFMRGIMGGLAGGFIGSMLFRNSGWGAGMGGMGGSGGFGMLEMILIAVAGFFLIRWVMGRAAMAGAGAGANRTLNAATTGAYATDSVTREAPLVMPEENATNALRRYDASFDAARFKDGRMDDFFKIQSAWSRRDFSPVRGLFTSDLAQVLESDASELKARGRINHLDSIAVRETELTEAWQEMGREYATVRFYANLVDYTTDERTGEVVDGDRNRPVKFEEYWTFTRPVGAAGSPWQLSAIEQGPSYNA